MDKKEGICFELSEKDILEETEENIFEHITKAVAKATAEGIRANSIVLNGNLVKVPEVFGMNPPMICGLRAYVTTLELPDGYAFSVQDDHMDTKPVTNKPLTVEELRQMHGEPVWIEFLDPGETCPAHWRIHDNNIMDCEWESYGTHWLAYRHKKDGKDGA